MGGLLQGVEFIEDFQNSHDLIILRSRGHRQKTQLTGSEGGGKPLKVETGIDGLSA